MKPELILRSIRFCMVGIVCCIAASASADIPPPPPEFPNTQIAVPRPESIAIGGLLISAAFVMAGFAVMGRKPGSLGKRMVGILGAILLLITGGATVWARGQYREYEDQRQNWRSNGPVRPPLPPIDEPSLEPGSGDGAIPAPVETPPPEASPPPTATSAPATSTSAESSPQ